MRQIRTRFIRKKCHTPFTHLNFCTTHTENALLLNGESASYFRQQTIWPSNNKRCNKQLTRMCPEIKIRM